MFIPILKVKNQQNLEAHGFTLIELTVVILFISALVAVALPNLIRQAGKAREVELKNVVGTINRAQLTYHWEKEVFAQGVDDPDSLRLLNLSFNNNYIVDYNIVANTSPIYYATLAPTNPNYQRDQTRAFSGLALFNAGVYSTVICQSLELQDVANIPSIPPAIPCSSDLEQLR